MSNFEEPLDNRAADTGSDDDIQQEIGSQAEDAVPNDSQFEVVQNVEADENYPLNGMSDVTAYGEGQLSLQLSRDAGQRTVDRSTSPVNIEGNADGERESEPKTGQPILKEVVAELEGILKNHYLLFTTALAVSNEKRESVLRLELGQVNRRLQNFELVLENLTSTCDNAPQPATREDFLDLLTKHYDVAYTVGDILERIKSGTANVSINSNLAAAIVGSASTVNALKNHFCKTTMRHDDSLIIRIKQEMAKFFTENAEFIRNSVILTESSSSQISNATSELDAGADILETDTFRFGEPSSAPSSQSTNSSNADFVASPRKRRKLAAIPEQQHLDDTLKGSSAAMRNTAPLSLSRRTLKTRTTTVASAVAVSSADGDSQKPGSSLNLKMLSKDNDGMKEGHTYKCRWAIGRGDQLHGRCTYSTNHFGNFRNHRNNEKSHIDVSNDGLPIAYLRIEESGKHVCLKTTLQGSLCPYSSMDAGTFYRHFRVTFHREDVVLANLGCKICKTQFASEESFFDHLSSSHPCKSSKAEGEEDSIVELGNKYVCHVCNIQFPNADFLLAHLRTAH